jgi:hypothetical protein
MTEYELLDLMASMEAHMGTLFTIYLTVLSAFLIVAYFVGRNLSFAQAWIASILMIFAAGGQTWALYVTHIRVEEYLARKTEFSPLTPYEQGFASNTYVWLMIMSCGVLASLYFMWSMRRIESN